MDILHLSYIADELGMQFPKPIKLQMDNTAAITISEKNGATKLTKHFDFAVHRLRDEVEHLRVKPLYVETYYQTADIFTKALDDTTFIRHRDSFFS